MRNNNFFALILFSFLAAGISASSCGIVPSSEAGLTSYCIPVNIVNMQSVATSTGLQVMFPFNTLPYTSILSSSMRNVYVYNGVGGTLVPAWIEGNLLNEQQLTNLNTVNDIIIWVNLGANIIPASGSANGIYYIGVGSTSTNFLINGNDIGEAPQLSCSLSANTKIGCSTNQYGEYDNGANVFSVYQNFAGTSTPSGFTLYGSGTTQDNGAYSGASSGLGSIITTANYGLDPTQIFDFFGNLSNACNIGYAVGAGYMGLNGPAATSGENAISIGTNDLELGACPPGTGNDWHYQTTKSGTQVFYDSGTAPLSGVFSVYWPSSSEVTYQTDYNTVTTESTNIPSAVLPIGVGGNSGGYQQLYVYFIRLRTYPPNGVMPSITFEAADIPYSPPSTPLLTSSPSLPATLDAGQQITFTASFNNGDPSYTYNYLIVNSITDAIVGNYLTTNSYSSNSFIWTATNSQYSYDLEANVVVIDSHPTTVNSVYINTLTVNPVLATPTISASNTFVDAGQYINFAAYETGGTLPYTYNFIVYNSVTNIQGANMLTSSNSFLWQANGNAGNTLVANVFVTDSASTSVTVNSLHSSQIVAYSTPSASLTVQTGSGIATNSILYGNSIITTAAVTGGSGTGNFIYAFTLDNAEAQNTVSSSTLSSTNTLDALTVPGNYVFNVIVTDTGTTIYYSVPQVTNTVVVESNDLLSATSSGNPGFAGFYSAVNITFTGTPTIGNQSAWSLYVNGALFGKTDSVMHWTEQGSPGIYSFTFTNPGNANYTSESLTSSLKVGSLGTGGSGVSSSSPPPSTIPPTTVPATSIPATSVVSTTTSIPTTTPPASTTSTIPPLLNSSVTSATVSANSSATIPAVINFGNSGAVIKAYSASQTPARIMLTISNASGSVKLAAGLYAVSVLNISSNSQLSRIDVNVSYPCSLPSNSVAPYMFVDGAWQKLANYTVNPSTCTVEVPSAHAGLIAVLSSASKPISLSTILLAVIAAMAIAFIAYIIHLKKLRSKPYK